MRKLFIEKVTCLVPLIFTVVEAYVLAVKAKFIFFFSYTYIELKSLGRLVKYSTSNIPFLILSMYLKKNVIKFFSIYLKLFSPYITIPKDNYYNLHPLYISCQQNHVLQST